MNWIRLLCIQSNPDTTSKRVSQVERSCWFLYAKQPKEIIHNQLPQQNVPKTLPFNGKWIINWQFHQHVISINLMMCTWYHSCNSSAKRARSMYKTSRRFRWVVGTSMHPLALLLLQTPDFLRLREARPEVKVEIIVGNGTTLFSRVCLCTRWIHRSLWSLYHSLHFGYPFHENWEHLDFRDVYHANGFYIKTNSCCDFQVEIGERL